MPIIEPLVGELGLRREDVRALAIANFRARTPNASIVPTGNLRRVVVGENLDGCALLFTKLGASCAEALPGGVLAMAPHRDVLLMRWTPDGWVLEPGTPA